MRHPELDAEIVWSCKEQSGMDAVIYLNGYSYIPQLARKLNASACRILYLCEPLSVYPLHYTRGSWKCFNHVITWVTPLANAGGKMHYMPIVHYDYPFPSGHGCISGTDRPLPDPVERETRLCQIVGDKYSPIVGQLYSLRRQAARWFNENSSRGMDVYGLPAMRVPNYRGATDSKLETFSRYRYAICFENLYHPVWSQGYLTEKIFDCMFADCIPIYYGCYNIEDYVPPDCFIDYRRFKDFGELDLFLKSLSDQDYLRYVRNIRRFLARYQPAYQHSCDRFYELVLTLVRQGTDHGAEPLPDGFIQTATPRELGAFVLMMAGLKLPALIHPVFRCMRRLSR
jgi:hypothetical protein